MSDTPFQRRDSVAQARINQHMRRKDVLEYLLARSLHAEPASPTQVKAFLATAPPEVFVALDGLLPSAAGSSRDESVHENPLVQGFVGLVLSGPKGER